MHLRVRVYHCALAARQPSPPRALIFICPACGRVNLYFGLPPLQLTLQFPPVGEEPLLSEIGERVLEQLLNHLERDGRAAVQAPSHRSRTGAVPHRLAETAE